MPISLNKATVSLDNLSGRTAIAGLWTLTGQVFRFSTTLITTAVLARLLTPADFGLIAMAMVVVGLATVFEGMGLNIALIQAEDVSEQEASNLFWANLAIGIGLFLLLLILAPLAKLIYGNQEVGRIIAFLGLSFVFGGLSNQHAAHLRRHLKIKQLTLAEYGGILTGSVVAVAVAMKWPSYWVLVIQILCMQISKACFCFTAYRWLPMRPSTKVGIGRFMSLGGKLTASKYCIFLVRNSDNFLLGKYSGAVGLGLYAKAYQILLLPVQQINAPLTTAFLPALSRLQDDPDRFRNWYMKGLGLTAILGTPIIIGIVVFAQEIVLLLLGQQWLPSVKIFYALLPAALMGVTNVATSWVYVPFGRTGRQFSWSFISLLVTLPAMILAVRWGPVGMALAVSITQILLRVPGLMYCYRNTCIHLIDYFKVTLPPLGISTLAALVALFVRYEFSVSTNGGVIGLGVLYSLVILLGYLSVYSIRHQLIFLMKMVCSAVRSRSRR